MLLEPQAFCVTKLSGRVLSQHVKDPRCKSSELQKQNKQTIQSVKLNTQGLTGGFVGLQIILPLYLVCRCMREHDNHKYDW